MFFDDAWPRPSDSHPSDSDATESNARFGTMLAEIWHDWFEAMSEVAYQTHRACEFLAENAGPSQGRNGPFHSRFARDPSEPGANDSIDMDKLKQCLQSMGPMQATQVMHAIQMMQAAEVMLKKRRSRADEAERPAW